jgi:hypothetical protein
MTIHVLRPLYETRMPKASVWSSNYVIFCPCGGDRKLRTMISVRWVVGTFWLAGERIGRAEADRVEGAADGNAKALVAPA